MKRRAFTLAGFFGAIGASISKALGYDGTPKPKDITGLDPAGKVQERTVYAMKLGRYFYINGLGTPLKELPEGVKHWSEAPAAVTPTLGGTKIDARHFRDELKHILALSNVRDVHQAVFDLYEQACRAVSKEESFCNGHTGPALGLTAHHAMTDMGDGRRLCPYCYNKEIADGRAGGTDEGTS